MAGFLLSVTRGAYCSTSSAKIWLDTVVPMFEPRITPSDCWNVSSPPFTSAITRMMVTDDESRMVVAMVPVARPAKRFVVNRPSRWRARRLGQRLDAFGELEHAEQKQDEPTEHFEGYGRPAHVTRLH